MSSSSPPYPYYNGIPFNPSFFTSNTSSGLTETAANALYLRKTVADTATVQETFTAGIKADSIQGIATTGTQSLYDTKTAGTLNIGTTQTSGNINIGAVGSTTTTTGSSVNINTTVGTSTGLFTTGRSYIGGTTTTNFAAHNLSQLSATYRDIVVMHATVTNGMAYALFRGVAGTNAGSIDNNSLGTGVVYSTSSDRRLKSNIQPMHSMLDNLMKLKPSKYNWISNMNIEDYGFIAQEVFELFPEMRNKRFNANDNLDEPCDENGNPVYYGLDYGKFTPYIVKAVQELKEDYDAKLSKLEQRLLALKTNYT